MKFNPKIEIRTRRSQIENEQISFKNQSKNRTITEQIHHHSNEKPQQCSRFGIKQKLIIIKKFNNVINHSKWNPNIDPFLSFNFDFPGKKIK